MEISLFWILSGLQLSFTFVRAYHNADFDGWYQPVEDRPADVITDVINNLGIRILQQYVDHGNVAFSPTGVGFVLAALYEGSGGRGSHQIADALHLPRNRDIARIGFRDIHRRLRTYLNADGFLGGLTLNRENTKLRPEYEDILRFYGFDVGAIQGTMNETTSAPEGTTTVGTDQAMATGQTATDMGSNMPNTVAPITDAPTTSAGAMDSQATTPMMETAPGRIIQSTESPSTTTTARTTLPNGLTENTVIPLMTTTQNPTESSTTQGTGTGASVEQSTMSSSASTTLDVSVMTVIPQMTTQAPNEPSPRSTTSGSTLGNLMLTTSTVPPMVQSTGSSSDSSSTTLKADLETTTMPGTTSATTTGGSIQVGIPSTTMSSDVTATTISPQDVRSAMVQEQNYTSTGPPIDASTVSTDLPIDGITTLTSSTGEIGSTNLPGVTDAAGATKPTPINGDSENRVRRRTQRSPRGYFSSYPDEGIWMQDLGIWKGYQSGNGGETTSDTTEVPFLVNGCDVSTVSATRYVAVLPFAYFPSLQAAVLEFPLDDPRYNILLLMPTDRTDTHRLVRDLDGKSLRLLRKHLQPTWVKATIPSFMLRGFVTLTSFLQRLGIIDVFEPRVADLSPMTTDLGVYARDIQQSIGVNIRNYMQPDRTSSRESPNTQPLVNTPSRRNTYRYLPPGNGLFERAGPVPFTVQHPFLYFIIDAETSATLIAGRVEDPLNSRIL